MLQKLSDFIFSILLYSIHDDCRVLDRFRFRRGLLPLVFTTISESVTEALNIVWPRPPKVQETELYDDGEVKIRLDWQPSLTSP